MKRRAMTWKLALLATAERARQGADAYAPGAVNVHENVDESDTTAEAAREYHRGAVDAFERMATWASELALKEVSLDAGRTLRQFVDAGHVRALDRAKLPPKG